jgi:hypothetical protein
MSNIEHFPSWYESLTANSEIQVSAATASLVQADGAAARDRVSAAAEWRPLPEHARAHHCWAHSTRRVDRGEARSLLCGDLVPQVGDLVLARVEQLGHHRHLQLADGRRRRLFAGDHVVVAYGHRYACEQFEAEVPGSMAPCHLVAGGGIAARALNWHDRIARGPTSIQPLGLLADVQGRRLNLERFAVDAPPPHRPTPLVLAVLGTAMDAGKTETAAHLVRGLRHGDRRVGYIKITGTGAGGDSWLLQDAGADMVLDFTDAGLPSTYRAPLCRIEAAMELLVGNMAASGIDTIVMEVADGVYQQETAALIRSGTFADTVSGIVLAARDAMGASAGLQALSVQPRPVLGISGLLSASPLQRREAESATGVATFDREALASAVVAAGIAQAASRRVDVSPAMEAAQ